MENLKPIVLIDDDIDYIDLMAEAYGTLSHKNKLLVFHDSIKAYNYLIENDVIPFLVISDIIMPKMNGFELRENVQANPKFSSHVVPFVFITGAAELPHDGHDHLTENGFFEKRADFEELRSTLNNIINYWDSAVMR
ncbi:response regulator [Flavobacterium rakeshii]|uniref:Response regulator n=1 Tax=Flavobacterium rakeshii TaxID=1038845 RepID=A0A6N8HFV5_9FLAO|nr:response regulator [Flavobacterium rakeshii]MUV04602.1 response regulator [Flavobacterium rakeshii]